jgi:hypothetical protein
VLLALLLAAPAPTPPAHLVVPESVRKQREQEKDGPAAQLSIFADPRLAEALGRFDAHPGAWVEYAVLPKRGPQVRLRAAVLAPALPDGRYWLEIATQVQEGPPLAMKMLLRGAPGRVENAERAFFYMGGQAPLELPLDDAREAGRPAARGALPKIERKGREEIHLTAGTFRCEVLQVKAMRIHRSDQVPLWGLVRARDPERRVELIGFARSGAETVFPPGFDDPQGKGSESVK